MDFHLSSILFHCCPEVHFSIRRLFQTAYLKLIQRTVSSFHLSSGHIQLQLITHICLTLTDVWTCPNTSWVANAYSQTVQIPNYLTETHNLLLFCFYRQSTSMQKTVACFHLSSGHIRDHQLPSSVWFILTNLLILSFIPVEMLP